MIPQEKFSYVYRNADSYCSEICAHRMYLLVVGCSCLGRMQSFISQLLYVVVGQAE